MKYATWFSSLVVAGVAASATGCRPPAPQTPDAARLDRLERRVDKIIEILEQALPPAEPDPTETYSVTIADIDPIEGPANARVTVVEGFEFLCPYCALVHPTVEALRAKYPRDVRVVAKYMVIHGAQALPPAQAACAANKQGKYSEMKAAIWAKAFRIEDERPVRQDTITFEVAQELASSLKLDSARFATDFDSKDCKMWAAGGDRAMGAVGASGTPAFFVNGRYVNGAVPLETLDEVVQEELRKADRAIAAGVRPEDYYASVVKKGQTKVKGRFD